MLPTLQIVVLPETLLLQIKIRTLLAAPSSDLRSIEEMMHVFDEYFKGDIQDMGRSIINNTNIEANVGVNATDFDLDFNGKVDQVEMPNVVKGHGRCRHGNCSAHIRIPDVTPNMDFWYK